MRQARNGIVHDRFRRKLQNFSPTVGIICMRNDYLLHRHLIVKGYIVSKNYIKKIDMTRALYTTYI